MGKFLCYFRLYYGNFRSDTFIFPVHPAYEIFKFLENNRDEETQNCFDVVIELQCLRFSSVCCPNLLPNPNPKIYTPENAHFLRGLMSNLHGFGKMFGLQVRIQFLSLTDENILKTKIFYTCASIHLSMNEFSLFENVIL